jgi:hypothetical protein
MAPTTVDEWRDELQRLRWTPGHDRVAVTFWRTWLDKNRDGPHYRHRECNRAVRQMTPRARAEYNEGRSLGRDAQVLRMGKRTWYVVTPHIGEPEDSLTALVNRRR